MSVSLLLDPLPKPWANVNLNSVNANNATINGTLSVNNFDVTGDISITGNLNLPNETANSALYLDNSNNISSASLTNGQILIGSSTGSPLAGNITGSDSIVVLNGANSISVNTSQDISTAGVPTFTGLIISNNEAVGGTLSVTGNIQNSTLGTNSLVQTDGSNNLSGLKLFDGQLAIGASAGQAQANNLSQGSFNSVTIANSPGNITLDCAQDIRSSANPTFNNLNLNGNSLQLGSNGVSFTMQGQTTGFTPLPLYILSTQSNNGSNASDMYIDSGSPNPPGLGGGVLIANNNAREVNVGHDSIPITLNGVINIPSLSANQLIGTDSGNNLISVGTLIYPTRATMWGDERLILSGSAFQLQTDPASLYCGYAFQTPALNGDSTSSSFFVGQGTYTVNVLTLKNSNMPIFTVYIDGVSIGTFDTYNASVVYNVVASFPSISISGFGRHTLTITVTGKNASSSGYILPICKAWVVSASDTIQTNPNDL